MGDLVALKATWDTLADDTTAGKLNVLNALMVPGPPQDFTVAALQDYLTTHNLLVPLTNYAASMGSNPGSVQSALIASNYLIAILSAADPIIHTSIQANFEAIQQLGPGLLADPNTGVTPPLLAGMMALVTISAPWWHVHGFAGPITITELIAAGDLY